jgi:hypothetical protein
VARSGSCSKARKKKFTRKALLSPLTKDLYWAAGFVEGEGMFASEVFVEVQNLYKAAIFHKDKCSKECPVSLYLLKRIAMRLREDLLVTYHERNEIDKMIASWPM